MASIYSNPDYVAKLPKTGFPHFQPINYSSIPGALVPTYCCDLLPGEKISGDISQFTRTRELETAAMTDIDEFVDFFFVPAKKIYSIFGEWFFNIDDNPTALRPSVNEGRVKYLPSVSPTRLHSLFVTANDAAYEEYEQGRVPLFHPEYYQFDTPANGMVRLLSHMRFDVFSLFDSDVIANSQRSRLWNIPLLPFLAYQAIYYDYYRDSNWQSNDVQAYNIDDWLTTLSQETITDERLLKIFKLQYRRQNSDYYVNTKPSPLQNATSMLNIDGVRESALLAVNDWLSPAGLSFDFVQKEGARTAVVMGSPIPTDGIEDSALSISGNGGNIGALATLSTSIVPNSTEAQRPEASVKQGVAFTKSAGYTGGSLGYGEENYPLNLQAVLQSGNVNVNSGVVSALSIQGLQQAIGALKSSISSNGVRVMFALEKLAKITARAGKHYDDQVLAHFGFKVPKGVSNEVYYVGGAHGEIHIGEVISPSTTEGSVAGEIVGKGYGGVKNGHVDFVAPCHGYFFAIYSSAPRRTYTPMGSPKEYSQFEREDFVQPELMDLGMQPLFDTEFSPNANDSDTIMGWQWRYQERKCRIPMAIGAFARYSDSDTTLNGALQDWTIQYPVLNLDHGVSGLIRLGYQNFLVNAQSFNSIMLLQWQPYFADHEEFHVSRVFDRDPLFHQYTNNLFLTSYMSTFGEPKLW